MNRYSNPCIASILERVIAGQKAERPSGRTFRSVRQSQHRLAPDEVFDLVRAYEDGTTIKQLTVKFQISRSTVMAHLKREGVKTRYNLMAGKLEEAKKLRAEGWSYARLGKHFGFTAQTVRRTFLSNGNTQQ